MVTILGGIAVIFFGASKAILMLGFSDPQMSSLKQEYDVNDDTKYKLTGESMPIVSMILMEGTGNKEDEIMKEIPLDDASRKYIHVTANNIIKTYESDKEKVTIKKYPMQKCLKSNMKSEYEK